MLDNKYFALIMVVLFTYCLTILIHWEDGLVEQIVRSFNLFTFIIVLLSLMMVGKETSFRLWVELMVFSSCIAFLFALLIYLNLLPIPSYRDHVERLFYAARTASVIDSTTGIWGVIGAIYILTKQKSLGSIFLGYIGFFMSIGLILLGGFRTGVITASLIISICYFLPPMRNLKRHYMVFIIGLLPVLILFGNQLLAIEGVQRLNDFIFASDRWHSLNLRTMERQLELNLIFEEPIWGHGWLLATQYSIPIKFGSSGMLALYGHCLYTAIPARIGIPAFLIIIAIFFLPILRGLRLMLTLPNEKWDIEIIVSILAVMAFLINSVFLNGLLIGTTIGFIAIFVARIFRYNHSYL